MTTHNEKGQLLWQKDIMFGFQKDLVACARAHCALARVWYNVDHRKSGEGNCLAYTLKRIQEMVLMEDLPFEGKNAPWIQNCLLLSRL